MSETAHDFFKRFIAFSIGPGVSAFIGFVSVPITTWLIAPEDFGRASMFTVFITLTSLVLFLGLDQAFVREFHATEEKQKILFHSVSVPLLFSILICGVFLIFYGTITTALYGSDSFQAAIITIVPVPFMVIERFNMLIIRMEEKGKLFSSLQILRSSLKVVFLIGFAYFHPTFFSIIAAETISICMTTTVTFVLVKRYWFFRQDIDKLLLRKLFRFGLPLVPATILGWILNAMDKVALRLWADFSEMGLYSAGFKVVSALLLFQTAFTTFWAPTAYRWFETGENIKKFERVSDFLSFCLCFVGGSIILFRHIIIRILATSYAPAAVVVPFLIYYPVLYTLSETTVMGIGFTRRTELGIWVSLVAAGANLLGNWLLVPQYGALGASIATAISYMAFFWMRTILSRTVWEKFPLKPHIVNLSLLIVMSVLAGLQDKGFVHDYPAYAGISILIVLLIFSNVHHLAYAKKTLFLSKS